jgi:hypothetical protein
MPRAASLPAEDRGDAVAIIEQLHRAGWSIGDVALRGEGGGLVWIVLGRCGSDLLMVSSATRPEAWRRALDQAAAVGVLRGRPRPACGEGRVGNPGSFASEEGPGAVLSRANQGVLFPVGWAGKPWTRTPTATRQG